jgi:hypothetical protein
VRADISTRRKQAAERQRAFRRRQKEELFRLQVEFPDKLRDDLIRTGRLSEADSVSDAATARAIQELVQSWQLSVTALLDDPLNAATLSSKLMGK